MQRKSIALWVSIAVIGVLVLGIAGVSLQADEPVVYRPNDRANHHPVHPND